MGHFYFQKENYLKSLELYNKSYIFDKSQLKLKKKINFTKKLIGNIQNIFFDEKNVFFFFIITYVLIIF